MRANDLKYSVKSLDFIDDMWLPIEIACTREEAIERAIKYGESNTTMTKHIRVFEIETNEMVWEQIVFCRNAKKGEEHKIFCGSDGTMFHVTFDWYAIH